MMAKSFLAVKTVILSDRGLAHTKPMVEVGCSESMLCSDQEQWTPIGRTWVDFPFFHMKPAHDLRQVTVHLKCTQPHRPHFVPVGCEEGKEIGSCFGTL